MKLRRMMIRAIAGDRGSTVAQSAAVALAAVVILGALYLVVPPLRSTVDQSYQCLIGAISGGGGGCGGGGEAAEAPPPAPEPPPEEEEDDDCGLFCQIGGVAKGIGEGIVDTVTGIGTLAVDAVKYAAGDEETRAKYEALVNAFREDPLGTTGALLEAMVEPMVTDWQEGRYGEAIGRGIFEVVSTIGGPKGLHHLGNLGKVDDIARVAGTADELGDAGRVVRNLPCVGAAPAGKAPGLARPAANECDLPAMPGRYDRGRAGYEKPNLDDETCIYCGRELTTEPRLRNSIEADHLVGLKDAWERGGRSWTAEEWRTFSNDLENLVAACKSCNASKQAKQLFDQWAPPNITPEARNELIRRIQVIVDRYKLDNP